MIKKYFTKKNIFITIFAILYLAVALVSLIHSFAFFGLANDTAMAILLGSCFELGQMAVLLSILTSNKNKSKFVPWSLMCLLTLVQILGNVFSSYKYLVNNAVEDLRYFKEPIFIWTDLPDDMTTVIITYIVGAILPIVALSMTAMVEQFIEKDDEEKQIPMGTAPVIEEQIVKNPPLEAEPIDNDVITVEEEKTQPEASIEPVEETSKDKEENATPEESHFINLKK